MKACGIDAAHGACVMRRYIGNECVPVPGDRYVTTTWDITLAAALTAVPALNGSVWNFARSAMRELRAHLPSELLKVRAERIDEAGNERRLEPSFHADREEFDWHHWLYEGVHRHVVACARRHHEAG